MAELLRGEQLNGDAAERIEGEGIYSPDYDIALSHQDADRDPAQLDAVLGLQAFVMSRVYPQATRTRASPLKTPRRHGFAIVRESIHSHESAYDGTKEQYMAYLVSKYNSSIWSMRVRFRSNTLSREEKAKTMLEDYSFMWTRDRVLTAAAFDGHLVVNDSTTNATNDIHHSVRPVANGEILELPERILDHATLSGAMNPRSWYHTRLDKAG
ncbi:hypothetical protein I8H83_04220 [Candidatus Saccharibacteria bacterium]|nr:hypothetical protein [Candidatus Saccharibacteria bacterium]